MPVVAKFKVASIGNQQTRFDADRSLTPVYTVRLHPVSDGSEENKRFFKWTPNGRAELVTRDRALAERFQRFGDFYVRFTQLPNDAPTPDDALVFEVQRIANQRHGNEAKIYTVELQGRTDGRLVEPGTHIQLDTINLDAAREFIDPPLTFPRVRVDFEPTPPAAEA